jgi:hypothetical protein
MKYPYEAARSISEEGKQALVSLAINQLQESVKASQEDGTWDVMRKSYRGRLLEIMLMTLRMDWRLTTDELQRWSDRLFK